MGREGAASPKGLSGTGDGPSIKILLHLRRPLGVKGAALAVVVVVLLGIVAFAATREATVTGRAHDDYLAAVQLFQKSALELEKMFDDGNDEHLLAAYSLSQEGSDKIREIGVRFWQDEFPPN